MQSSRLNEVVSTSKKYMAFEILSYADLGHKISMLNAYNELEELAGIKSKGKFFKIQCFVRSKIVETLTSAY